MIRVPWKLVLLRPMNAARLLWSLFFTFVWGIGRLIKFRMIRWLLSQMFDVAMPVYEPRWAFSWSRLDSPKPVWCRFCGWVGPLSSTYHGYAAIGEGDVEIDDFCPRCDSNILEPAAFVRGGVWSS